MNREDRQVSNLREHSSGGPPGTFELSVVFSVMHFSERILMFIKFSKENIAKNANNHCFRRRRGSRALTKDMRDQLTCCSSS